MAQGECVRFICDFWPQLLKFAIHKVSDSQATKVALGL